MTLTRKLISLACATALCASPSALAAKQQDYEQLRRADSDFKFDGYFRSGYATGVERPSWGGPSGQDGGDCSKFGAAGTPASYRLGNECDDYAEIGLHKRVYTGDDGEQFWVHTRMSYGSTDDNTFSALGGNDEGDVAIRELFAEAQDVVPFWSGAKVWAGKRFYQRHDVHINDFFFWGASGTGGGVEDIPVGDWKGHVSIMRTKDSDGAADQRGINFDLRLSNINTNPNGQLTGGFSFANPTTDDKAGSCDSGGHTTQTACEAASGTWTNPAFNQSGWAFTLMHQQNSWFGGGFNKFAVQYGKGALGSPWTVGDIADEERIREQKGDEWKIWRVVEMMTIEPAGTPFSAMASAIYQNWERHNNEEQQWLSLGFRPQWHITDHFALVAEASYDKTSFTNLGCHGGGTECDSEVTKFTFAPTFTAGSNFFSRPQIRAFVTHAQVDNKSSWAPEEDDSYTVYGIQAEAWW